MLGELSELIPPAERPAFWEVARVAENLFHHFSDARRRGVTELYAGFDPDGETVPAPRISDRDPVGRLDEGLGVLLERANFDRAPDAALMTQADADVLRELDLDADLGALEQLSVYHRGRGSKAVRIRRARKLFRLQEEALPTFRRVALLVRTHEDPHVYLKLFKDVPCRDLELLLPTVRVKMKLFDKLKLSGSSGAALVSAWKLLRMAYSYAPTLAKLIAVPFKLFLLPVVLLVGVFYGGKTLMDYSKIRAAYVTALAERLYAITMASNRAVLARLADMAGEEDTKEFLIAYALLYAQGPVASLEELQQRAEAFVWDRYRARVRFDVEDAVHKLDELAITWRKADGRLGVVPFEAALRTLDGTWDELYSAPRREKEQAHG
ncbi:MAG: DUF3754 domain-containing protein [Planctomycetes bacterium]|nr:DUF3754 domain-containing protein [Planctomycetota bacterium]